MTTTSLRQKNVKNVVVVNVIWFVADAPGK